MDEPESLSHSKWECKYHVVFIPKCRRKTLYEQLRRHLGEVFRKLAEQKESRILEGHLMSDHVHMLIAIPPKYAVSQVVGYIKGKSAIHLARVYGERRRNFVGQSFWARGYFVSTVGRDEATIRGSRRDSHGKYHSRSRVSAAQINARSTVRRTGSRAARSRSGWLTTRAVRPSNSAMVTSVTAGSTSPSSPRARRASWSSRCT